MAFLTELVRNLILIVLLTTFLEMIMPSDKMQRFVKVVLSLFILFTLLNPLINFINEAVIEDAFQEAWTAFEMTNILTESEQLQMANDNFIKENYRQELAAQMKLLLTPLCGKTEVNIELQTIPGEIEKIIIKEVLITVNESEKGGVNSGEIKQYLAENFALSADLIQVNFV
ncbi:MAG TPA: stage III sporulation protein AF [Clostridia bacterium]|nr:stage III sporulation protein AF [Clostridia bacterium]